MEDSKPRTHKVKRIKVPNNRQVAEIVRLLVAWPTASSKVVEEFVFDTLNVKYTRSCMQEAKRQLGLSKPGHTEFVLQKKVVTEMYLLNQFSVTGVWLLNPILRKEWKSAIKKILFEKFGTKTKELMLDGWMDALLDRLRPVRENRQEFLSLIESIRNELKTMGFDTTTTQRSLL